MLDAVPTLAERRWPRLAGEPQNESPLRSSGPGVYFTTDVTSERHVLFRRPTSAAPKGEPPSAPRAIRPDLRMDRDVCP